MKFPIETADVTHFCPTLLQTANPQVSNHRQRRHQKKQKNPTKMQNPFSHPNGEGGPKKRGDRDVSYLWL